ncbi:carboxypeptidase regulatory-like domain-containing protein [Chloroflexota bacterium]
MRIIMGIITILALLTGSFPFLAQPAVAADGEVLNLPPLQLPDKGNPKLDSQLNQLVSAETSAVPQGPIIIQPGTEGIDTFVREGAPSTNYGNDELTTFGGWFYTTEGTEQYLYTEFDLSSIPSGTSVSSARLDFYMHGQNGYMAYDYGVYKITENWEESQVTWNNQPTCDVSPVTVFSGFAWQAKYNQWHSIINLAGVVQEWVNTPSSNFGIVIKPISGSYGYPYLRSSDYSGDPTLRPKLVINYEVLDHFNIASMGNQTAGVPFSITITATDDGNNTDTSYTGSNTLSDSTGTISPTQTDNFTEGAWTGDVTITQPLAGNVITTSGEGKTGISNSFSVADRPSEVWVDDGWAGSNAGDTVGGHTFGTDAFATIQDGVNAVSGSTVHVAEGIYGGFKVINKQNLSIVATGNATVTTAVTYAPDNPWWVMAHIKESTSIKIHGVNFDGAGLNTGGGKGIYYDNSTGNLTGLTVKNINFPNWHVAISVWGVGENITSLGISDVNVYNSMEGVWATGIATCIIDSSRIIGNRTNGVRGLWAAGNGVNMTDSVISDWWLANPAPDNAGIGIDANKLIMSGNTISNNNIGILVSGNLAANSNNIFGNDVFGIKKDDPPSANATGNWWGDASGPVHASNPGGSGDNITDNVYYNPWLNAPYSGGEPVTTGSISGHVYQAGTTNPIEGADVVVYKGMLDVAASSVTDQNGYYQVTGLPTGEYAIQARAAGYAAEWYQESLRIQEAATVSVTAPDDMAGIDFTLEPGSTISGHVYQQGTTDGIANAMIIMTQADSQGGFGMVLSGPEGSYTTFGLPAGEYDLWALAQGYAGEWYHESYSSANANPVQVTVPGNVAGIDFTLEPGSSISGQVKRSDDLSAVEGAQIVAFGPDNRPYALGWSQADGSYTTTGLLTGEYIVQATAPGYITEWYNNVYNWNEATPVTVTAPVDTPNINFNLEPGSTISGYIYQSDNTTPVKGARVTIFDYDSLHSWWFSYTGASTDDLGYYKATRIPSRSCAVRVTADGYATEWYDNTYFKDEATSIDLNAPQDIENINFMLEPGGSISGHVYESDNTTPITNLHLSVIDNATGKYLCGTNTDTEGHYTLPGLANGSYKVKACASCSKTCPTCPGLNYVDEYYGNVYSRDEAMPVTVTAPNDTPNINFSLDQGGTISGNVYQPDNTTPISNASVRAYEYDSLSGHWVYLGEAETDTNGHYVISNLPTGNYGVRVEASGYATEWYNNKYYKDEAMPVPVTAPNDTQNINFSLDSGGSISGHVYESDNTTPIANIHVYATDNETHQWIAGADTDASGSYTISGLPAGSYKVKANPCSSSLNYINEWYNDKFSWEIADQVTVIPPNDTSGIDFSLDDTVPRATVVAAIADGVDWLASQQNADGSWGTNWPVAKTALAVLKLETHATDIGTSADNVTYQYYTHVVKGLNYLFASANTTDIGLQNHDGTWDDPDTNGNSIGVYFSSPDFNGGSHHVPVYETSITMMALGASKTPAKLVNVAGSPVNGWTYAEVLQDAVDYLACAQTDSGFGRGGWNYDMTDNRGDRADQSNSGWVTLGLAYAEDPATFGLTIPNFVRTELDRWIDYIQDDTDGGAWYTGPDDPQEKHHDPATNMLRTGNLLQQMAFLGDTIVTPRVKNAIDFLVNHWNDNSGQGWGACPTDYHTTYTVMKGLEALGTDNITSSDNATVIYWFPDFVAAILSEQAADGWWPVSNFDDGEHILSTEWAMLTLQKVIPPTLEKPDLVVTEKHEEWYTEDVSYRVHYTIKNKGNVPLTVNDKFYMALIVDGEARNIMPHQIALEPGASWSYRFDATQLLSDGRDTVACVSSFRTARAGKGMR